MDRKHAMFIIHQIQNITQDFPEKIAQDSFRGHLIRGSVGSFFLRIASIGLMLIHSVVLARFLGINEYGIYEYVITWMNMLIIPAVFGLDRLLVRHTAAYQTQLQWGLIHGLIRWSFQIVLIFSLLVALGAASFAWMFPSLIAPAHQTIFWVGCVLIPISALNFLRGGVLRGLHHVNAGLLPETIIRPILAIILTIVAGVVMQMPLMATWGVSLYIVATSGALIVGSLLLSKFLPQAIRASLPEYKRLTWLSEAFPIALTTGLTMINTRLSILVLGGLEDSDAVAIFAVARRITDVLAFALLIANTVLAPTFASLHASQNLQALQRLVTRSSQLILLGTLFLAVFILGASPWILRLFGPAFAQSQSSIFILAGGQIFNATMGSVGMLLMMTGYARDTTTGMILGLLVNLALCFLMIPHWGVEGAAWAAVVSTIVWNIILAYYTYRRLKIYPSVIGNIKPRYR